MGSFSRIVGQKIQEERISIRRLARQSGMDASFLAKVLSGKRSPPADEKLLRKLAKCLGVDPTLLIISTGIIPSELQLLMERPEFYKRIASQIAAPAPKSQPRPSSPAAARPQKAAPHRGPQRGEPMGPAARSSELSEDLL